MINTMEDLVPLCSIVSEIASTSLSIEEIEPLPQWHLPKLKPSNVYQLKPFILKALMHCYIYQNIISIEDIQLDNHFLTFLKKNVLDKYMNVGYKFLHLGCVQTLIFPLFRRGLNAFVLACLMDSRHIEFVDALIGVMQAPLHDGPIYLTVYPNFAVSLSNPHILIFGCMLNNPVDLEQVKPKFEGSNMSKGKVQVIIQEGTHTTIDRDLSEVNEGSYNIENNNVEIGAMSILSQSLIPIHSYSQETKSTKTYKPPRGDEITSLGFGKLAWEEQGGGDPKANCSNG